MLFIGCTPDQGLSHDQPRQLPASDPPALIERTVLLKTSQSWDGADLPAYPQGTPEISVIKVSIPPGTALPMHRHAVINAGVLLSGELTVTTEYGQTHVLAEGEPLSEVVGTWHFGKSTGTGPAVALVVYVGTTDLPNSELMPEPLTN